jgi:hypothetical protein
MEAVGSTKTLELFYHTTLHHISEDGNLSNEEIAEFERKI